MNNKACLLAGIFVLVAFSPLVVTSSADDHHEIEILSTEINPSNNHTYHLLSASSWTEAANAARSLGGFLVTINDETEDSWIFETFASTNDTTRHIWIGLSDSEDEGNYQWQDGTPFIYRNWGDGQPGDGEDEDYIHITGTNMGSIEPSTWNDLENDPQYFPVYGVVEVGQAADYSLRFDGYNDFVIVDDDFPSWNGNLILEASVNIHDTSGIQFVTMLGDYGWGLYINDGYLAYSNEYSISRNPTSIVPIAEDEWTHIKVQINSGQGGEFFIDNLSAGTFDANYSQIPYGDFGSNDCFQSGEDCDELYIGRMGAGCDCNYLRGMLDDLMIGNNSYKSVWTFSEGEGEYTEDNLEREGFIDGASWVMPDGTIVAQAVELENDEDYTTEIDAGETLLFFMEIPENTRFLILNIYSWGFDEYDEEEEYDEIEYEIFLAKDRVPTDWDHDHEIIVDNYYGIYAYEYFEWPEEGIYWLTVNTNYPNEEFEIYAYWEEAPEPPELDEMTELNDGIAVVDQEIPRNSGDSLYYYVELEDNLAELRVKTWGDRGNCDLHIAKDVLPFYDDYYWIGFENEFDAELKPVELGETQTSDSSISQGNQEIVQIFDAEPGIYYVMLTSNSGCRDVSIQADFTYSPENIEPESAVELTPGIPYGPLSGFEGLDQYFFIEVPPDVERLEVDLNNGAGEAKLMMRLEEFPTWSTYDMHSNTPGAGDKIGFNDPTPGKWYILLGSEQYYSRVDITASFKDRFEWSYDGEPIQLFNNEEINGMNAPEDEELLFFIDLGDTAATNMVIQTWGGEGDLELVVEPEELDWTFEGNQMGRQIEQFEYSSDISGTDEMVNIWYAEGEIEVIVYAKNDIEDISIIATWEILVLPEPRPEPEPEPISDDEEPVYCDDYAEDLFEEMDENSDYDLSEYELKEYDDFVFQDIDYNSDNVIDLKELTAVTCACENEILIVFDELDTESIDLDYLLEVDWKNEYEFSKIDINQNEFVDIDEVEKYITECVSTFDPFDRDGDGVEDTKDDFPDNPLEDTDTDGDGIGDNSDIIASVDNDIIWISASIIGVMLISLLAYLLVRVRRTDEKDWIRRDENFSENMLLRHESSEMSKEQIIVPPALDLGEMTNDLPEDMIISDLYDP